MLKRIEIGKAIRLKGFTTLVPNDASAARTRVGTGRDPRGYPGRRARVPDDERHNRKRRETLS